MKQTFKKSLLTIAISATLAACGGGGSSTGGVDGTTGVTSSGTVSGFGSVIVNGVRYKTTGATVKSDDDGTVILKNPSDDQLKTVIGLGEVVRVRGSRSDDSNGTADTIFIDNELVSTVTSISDADASFVVLGQTISVTPDTIIDDSLISDAATEDATFGSLNVALSSLVSVDMLVEISGFATDNGFEATRIEDVDATGGALAGEAEIKGFVENLTAGSFQINALTVNFDEGDLDSEDFFSRDLAEGDFVEVHGTASGLTLDATKIELEDDLFDGNDDSPESGEIEIEGVISSIVPDGNGGGDVVINGITLKVNDISQLNEGLRVEIKGILQADGSIVLTRLQDEEEDSVRTEDIASLSGAGDSFVTRLGLDIMPSSRSRLEDDTIEDDDNLSIADFLLSVDGKRIEARGFPLNGAIAWTRLEIEDDNDLDCSLRGPVASVTGNVDDFSFIIDGGNIDITINVDQVSESNFEGSNDLPIGRQAFFDLLEAGVVVEASSVANGGCNVGELTAREVEFQPADDVLFSGDDNGGNVIVGDDNEVFGSVSAITDTGFMFNGESVAVNGSTLIDDSIIEDSRGVELDIPDQPLGNIDEVLTELLIDGGVYFVVIDRSSGSPVAVEIED